MCAIYYYITQNINIRMKNITEFKNYNYDYDYVKLQWWHKLLFIFIYNSKIILESNNHRSSQASDIFHSFTLLKHPNIFLEIIQCIYPIVGIGLFI